MAMADDVKTPDGLTGPDEKVSVSWLILQRLDDLKSHIADVRHDLEQHIVDVRSQVMELRQDVAQFRQSTDVRFQSLDHRLDSVERRFDSLERRWTWSIGLIAVMALGLLAKLLIPGA